MSDTDHSDNPFHIPGKKMVFEALVSGKHLSLHSGEVYRYLQQHESEYQNELSTLGYTLVHEQDYYYLQVQDENKASDYSRKALVFIAIMLEFIAQKGQNIIETLYCSQGFERDQLPHFSSKRYKSYMQHIGIDDEKALNTLLKYMDRSGFVEYRDNENFLRFLSPCQRFINLALQVLEQQKKQATTEESP